MRLLKPARLIQISFIITFGLISTLARAETMREVVYGHKDGSDSTSGLVPSRF